MLKNRRIISRVFALLCGFFVMTASATAQVSNISSSAGLVIDPEYPSPFSEVSVSLDAYSMDISGATVLWYINGTERLDARNARNITLTTSDLNDKQTVLVKIQPPNSPTLSLTRTITPSVVDVVLESQTYVPAFYKGRALPSSESVVRAIAVTHTSPSVSPSSLTYEWMQGETVLFGGPIKGKYVADLTMSRFDDDYIRVRVTNSSGNVVGGKTLLLTPVEPELHFYEENPLRGLSGKAIKDSLILIGDETTIHAEPYFMTTKLASRTVKFDWTIGGVAVVTNQNDPHTLTVRKAGNGGSTEIGVNAITTSVIPQYVQDTFTIMF